jgi:proteic killer suppression protein
VGLQLVLAASLNFLILTSTVNGCTIKEKGLKKKCRVWQTKFAEKQVSRLPKHIKAAFYFWVDSVELDGVYSTRTLPGYHDEPLKGDRKGHRSVRLSKAYRIVYEESEAGEITLIGILEVNKHEY